MYIFRPDKWGSRFAALLADRAAAGVKVRVLCDWFGCWATPRRLFQELQRRGGEMRFFNPPSPVNPFAAMRRNHRKVICIDGSIAFVSGLCIADPWMGDRGRGIPPWRDTGVELRGPSVADAEHAFSRSWREASGLWTRVGSTNLNAGSWMNNWEMDVRIEFEDAGIARQMEARYEADLQNTDEIVRTGANGALTAPSRSRRGRSEGDARHKGMRSGAGLTGQGSGGQLLREVGTLGSAVGAAVTGTRPLEDFEFRPLVTIGSILLLVAGLGFWKPQIVFWPLGVLLAAVGLQLICRGIQARVSPSAGLGVRTGTNRRVNS